MEDLYLYPVLITDIPYEEFQVVLGDCVFIIWTTLKILLLILHNVPVIKGIKAQNIAFCIFAGSWRWQVKV